jgi:hypothetical protein
MHTPWTKETEEKILRGHIEGSPLDGAIRWLLTILVTAVIVLGLFQMLNSQF